MLTSAELVALQGILRYHFRDKELLLRALTHSSRVHEAAPAKVSDNEQLEFLGDAILGFLVSDLLVAQFPHYAEGRLTQMKAHLVSSTHLYEVALALDLGRFLQLGKGEEMSGGRTKRTLLADAFEALLAAMYLDGGIDPVRELVSARVMACQGSALEAAIPATQPDFRRTLEDMARDRNLPAPRYTLVSEQGKDSSKVFTIEVRIGIDWTWKAEGGSKKSAAQRAARELCERMAR